MALTDCTDQSGSVIGGIRREIVDIARGIGFRDRTIAELEIVGTELAMNLLHHNTVDGAILVSPIGEDDGIEIVSVDRGPGIEDVEAALQDYHSTNGTLGCGLGSVHRLMDEFDIYSESVANNEKPHGYADTGGTVVMTRKWLSGQASANGFRWGVVSQPCEGETAIGDAVFAYEDERGFFVAVADGLGHGPHAERASSVCMNYIKGHRHERFEFLIKALHEELRGTNGVALTLVHISPDRGRLVHCGVGNVTARCWPHLESSLIPQPGIIGSGRLPRVSINEMDWCEGTTVFVYSDGISDRWAIDDVPAPGRHHVSTISHYLANRFARPTDDATIVTIQAPRR